MKRHSSSTKDCDEIYRSVIEMDTSDNYSLFKLAQCFIDGYDPDKLRLMLRSDDKGIVIDGLFVLAEVGELAARYAADVRALSASEDSDVRRMASQLAHVFRGAN